MPKRVIISQPMRDKSITDILTERRPVVDMLQHLGFDVVDTVYTSPFPEEKEHKDRHGLFCLSKILAEIAAADLVVFMPGWQHAGGCRIEFECCKHYNIPFIESDALNSFI